MAAQPSTELFPEGNGTADRQVLIVEDQRAVAEAIGIAIGVHEGLTCRGVVGSVDEALTACSIEPVDVVLMDMQLPDTSGIEGVGLIKERWPDTDVYIFTAHGDLGLLLEAAANGASGFFLKDAPIAEVLDGIRWPHNGHILIDAAALAGFLERRRDGTQREQYQANRPALTEREWLVLSRLCDGRDPQAIALELGLSVFTARGHVKSILAKLDVHSQLEAVVLTLRNHWLDPVARDPA